MIRVPRVSGWIIFCVAICLLPAVRLDAQSSDARLLEARREQARIDRLWNRAWRELAPYYIKHDGRFVCVPGYDARIPSSLGVTARDYLQESSREQEYTDDRGRERTRTQVKPDAEAYAAVALIPEVAVGRYGFIHSGGIETIVDDNTLILEEVWLLDAAAARQQKQELKDELLENFAKDIEQAIRNRGRDERRNRGDGILQRRDSGNESIDWAFEDRDAAADRQRDLAFARYEWKVIGYRTDRLTQDERWPTGRAAERGLQLVIVDITGNTVTAVPTASIGKEITEVDVLDLLKHREITKPQFVEMITDAKRQARNDYLPLVLAQLEGEEIELAVDPEDGPNDAVELAD